MHPFGLILLVFSSLLTVELTWVLYRALASRSWTPTSGKIVSLGLAPVSLTAYVNDVQPLVRYRYSVNGIKYEGQTISVAEGWATLWGRRRFPILDEFQPGQSVTVWHNPRKPADSALFVGPVASTYLRPAAAFMTMIVALSILL
jgi:hypothetical protein